MITKNYLLYTVYKIKIRIFVKFVTLSLSFYAFKLPTLQSSPHPLPFKGRFLKIGCSADKEDKVGKWTRKKNSIIFAF